MPLSVRDYNDLVLNESRQPLAARKARSLNGQASLVFGMYHSSNIYFGMAIHLAMVRDGQVPIQKRQEVRLHFGVGHSSDEYVLLEKRGPYADY